MPLAFGCLFGGMTTQIGTPPNILATEFLREEQLSPFLSLISRPLAWYHGIRNTVHGSCRTAPASPALLRTRPFIKPGRTDWQRLYNIEKRLFHALIPAGSSLAGKNLATVNLGLILGWNIISITRNGQNIISPGSSETIEEEDLLTIEGRLETLDSLKNLVKMKIERADKGLAEIFRRASCSARCGSPQSPPLQTKQSTRQAFTTTTMPKSWPFEQTVK
jgi:hypothetical protein